MSVRKAIISVFHLFAGFSFFASGLFFLSLPFLPRLRISLANALLGSCEGCVKAGIGLLSLSAIWTLGIYSLSRGRTLEIGMGGRKAVVDAEILRKTLEECFRGNFEGRIVLSDFAVLGKTKLSIEVFLTPFEESLREELFASVQNTLGTLLKERFGYEASFSLIVKSH